MRRCTCTIRLQCCASRMSGTVLLKFSKDCFLISNFNFFSTCLKSKSYSLTNWCATIAGPGNANDSQALWEALQHPSDLRYPRRPGALRGCTGQGVCHFDSEDKGRSHHWSSAPVWQSVRVRTKIYLHKAFRLPGVLKAWPSGWSTQDCNVQTDSSPTGVWVMVKTLFC